MGGNFYFPEIYQIKLGRRFAVLFSLPKLIVLNHYNSLQILWAIKIIVYNVAMNACYTYAIQIKSNIALNGKKLLSVTTSYT